MITSTTEETSSLNEGGSSSLEINLDAYEEYRIQSYDINGNETRVPNLGAEENFAQIIHSKFDFLPTLKQRQLESIHVDDTQTLPPPQIRVIQDMEWEKTVYKLRGAIHEIQYITDISRMMKEASEEQDKNESRAQLIETVHAHRSFNEDLKTSEKAGELFPSRIEQLVNTHSILKTGKDQLSKRVTQTASFYQQLFQLQKKWKLKSFDAQNANNIILDLAFNFPAVKLYEYIPVKIIRKKNTNQIDAIIPAIATYGRRVLLSSVILKHYPETLKTIDHVLDRAQQSIFYLELFDMLVNCVASKSKNVEFPVMELTDQEIKIQISGNAVLVVTLVESQTSPFWEIQTRMANIAPTASHYVSHEVVDTLLQDALIQIHNLVRNNSLTLEKATTIFEHVFKYLRHKLLCARIEACLRDEIDSFSISPELNLVLFKYPETSIYDIRMQNNIFKIHLKQNHIYLQSKRFNSVKELICYLDLIQ
ncbi:hypothetical protein C9374_012607 [Naegleria lovaniensis]|uniref:Mediator complex subunit 17 n=1 Tax=Naegleria lovaniensis TaxID=51637 RepID=A0AA88H021_NAELO|nr:uncharacterized protein C9374_012607 [Naegleria lovaniensis]KAG2392355.1 hypothetical protein C9374_012607 [Naegleria lovaniensis]